MTCCVCDVIIKGLYGPCLRCGHVSHADCHEEWFKNAEECPTGCGCNCAQFAEGGFRFEWRDGRDGGDGRGVPGVNISPPKGERNGMGIGVGTVLVGGTRVRERENGGIGFN
jgi:WD repeat-containing protein 59